MCFFQTSNTTFGYELDKEYIQHPLDVRHRKRAFTKNNYSYHGVDLESSRITAFIIINEQMVLSLTLDDYDCIIKINVGGHPSTKGNPVLYNETKTWGFNRHKHQREFKPLPTRPR
eukprot:TRINITY_DN31499_c0_g1_i1.p1 TRINITY_DN31499_c0_g1~~TRINITY_DN31499_c0_g1_i1.p1  ORF type:complete len:116 (+),score=11.39 TRINITY_DN31499_c0_g1_i1:356-703(+)